ncbi:MAG: hypothetical protein ACK5JT_00270, partial [Hyphomicrobiaceae bacterium]
MKCIHINPTDRLVVLATAIQADDPSYERMRQESGAGNLGPNFIGREVFRHHTDLKQSSDSDKWSHLELHYFRHFADDTAIAQATDFETAECRIRRVELLVTTPDSFILPRGWNGACAEGWQVSLEYIDA